MYIRGVVRLSCKHRLVAGGERQFRTGSDRVNPASPEAEPANADLCLAISTIAWACDFVLNYEKALRALRLYPALESMAKQCPFMLVLPHHRLEIVLWALGNLREYRSNMGSLTARRALGSHALDTVHLNIALLEALSGALLRIRLVLAATSTLDHHAFYPHGFGVRCTRYLCLLRLGGSYAFGRYGRNHVQALSDLTDCSFRTNYHSRFHPGRGEPLSAASFIPRL